MKKIAEFLILGLLLSGGVSVAGASDWPQWRGPNRDGISRETGLLKEWPDGGPQVLWRVPLGEGFFRNFRRSRTCLYDVLGRR